MTKVSDIGERQLINRLAAILDVNARDDCAIISFAEMMGSNAVATDNNDGARQHNLTPSIVLTTDMLHRTTDFPDGMSYTDIGWMSVAVSLSDIASMGARPIGVMAALGIPQSMDVRDVEDIAKGMAECTHTYNTSIIGGDTDSHDELTIVTSAIGLCENGNVIKRSGAKVGDLVCVCKTLGGADAALRLLGIGKQGEHCTADIPDNLLAALYRPTPCVFEGIALAHTGVVTSMMDISDGLSLSLMQLSDASHIGFEIEQSAVPVHPDAESILGSDKALECALYGGGDFGLLFTIKADRVEVARKACSEMHVIGRVLEYGEIVLKHNGACTPLGAKGYEHFKTRD